MAAPIRTDLATASDAPAIEALIFDFEQAPKRESAALPLSPSGHRTRSSRSTTAQRGKRGRRSIGISALPSIAHYARTSPPGPRRSSAGSVRRYEKRPNASDVESGSCYARALRRPARPSRPTKTSRPVVGSGTTSDWT
jgi:hypothetical protein